VIKEIIFSGDIPRQTIASRVERGELRQVIRGVYTTDLVSSLEAVVAKHWHGIAGHLFPNAVITDRSAPMGGRIGEFLYLAHNRRPREVVLPGLTILARLGSAPIDGDIALPGGLYQASRARALAENTRASRASKGRDTRTLNDTELSSWINLLCQNDGEENLRAYRLEAEQIATQLDVSFDAIARLGKLIGAALGSQQVDSKSRALNARQQGIPFDGKRIELFDDLVAALRSSATQSRRGLDPASNDFAIQAFYEAYFSNYIEGTTFTVEEARSLVYQDVVPPGRHADGHDVTGTFRIVSNFAEISQVATNANGFLELLRSRHEILMAGRPDKKPGEFKQIPNQAGSTRFVDPALVIGTLAEGFARLKELDSAWERSVYIGFLIAEVHPFVDSNGRMARVMMNAELVKGGQSKIVVPTGFRNDYLTALRRLSRDSDPSVFIKSMRFLHDYTQQIDWSTHDSAIDNLTATNAFQDESDAPRLTLLRPIERTKLHE
jgi:Fic/DOC family